VLLVEANVSSVMMKDATPAIEWGHGGLVLVADDDADARCLVVRALEKGRLHTMEARNGDEALALAVEHAQTIDAIMLDVQMPGMTGFEVVKQLKHVPAAAHIPVILITASATDEDDIVRGVEYGAIDYLTKPYPPAVLSAKVRRACERSRNERRLRHELRFAELHAMLDPLTGLFNRWHFEGRMREATAYARRHEEPFSAVILDLDEFKSVNDTHGHEEGDRVLVHFATAIRAVLRGEDIAFRYGGDEFVLLLRACDAKRAVEVGERLRRRLHERPFYYSDGTKVRIPFSGGAAAALFDEGFSGDELLTRADAALYRAKDAGRDRVVAW